MQIFEIPLNPQAQSFLIPLAGTTYSLRLYWNTPASCWGLDIADASAAPLVRGIPLVTGVDLLAQYAYLNFPGALICQTDHDPDAVPTFTNLGLTSHLYFVLTGDLLTLPAPATIPAPPRPVRTITVPAARPRRPGGPSATGFILDRSSLDGPDRVG